MRIQLATLAIAIATASTMPLCAQTSPDIAPGLQPFQSYQGGNIDAVNLGNGNLTVKIPLISYPQRGGKLKLAFSLLWNGKPWVPTHTCVVVLGKSTCTGFWAVNGSLSSALTSPAGMSVIDDQDVFLGLYEYAVTAAQNPNDVVETYSIAEWHTADGSIHPGGAVTGSELGQVSIDGAGYFTGYQQNWGTGEGPPCTAYCYTTDSEGVSYHLNQLGLAQPTMVLRQDSNGNQITTTNSNEEIATYVDTMGRVIPAPPTAATASTSGSTTGCAGPLSTYSTATWTVPGANGSQIQFKFCYAQVSISLPASISGGITVRAMQTTSINLQSIVLPNGQTWIFQYNSRSPGDPANLNYGDLTQITFPTGGTLAYAYKFVDSVFNNNTMVVIGRQLYDGFTTQPWTYSGTYSGTVAVVDPLGNETDHVFAATGNSNWDFYESSKREYQGPATNGALLTTTTPSYTSISWLSADPAYSKTPQVILGTGATTALPNGSSSLSSVESKTLCCAFSFNADEGQNISGTNGLTATDSVYDYASSGTGPLLRSTQTTYEFQQSTPYAAANLLSLPASISVVNSQNVTVSSTTYGYDQYSLNKSGLGSQQQLAAPLFSVSGNLTTKTTWLNGGTSPQTQMHWWDTGMLYQRVDPSGNLTTYNYSSTYGGGYLTSVQNALGQPTVDTYDFNLGGKLSLTDPNTKVTSWTYDNFGRMTKVQYPNTFNALGTLPASTSYCYNDTAGLCVAGQPIGSFVATKAISPGVNLEEEVDVDGVGRQYLTKLLTDPTGTTYGRQSYDGLGHISQVWNSTRCNPLTQTSCTGETTWGVTTHSYDGLGRETLTIPPDGTSSTDNVKTSYVGNTSTVTDEAGVSRQFTKDALGRLTQVTEVNPGWVTQYQYDALNNLLCVEQHGGVTGTGCSSAPANDATSPWRVRRFTYDSLSRLLTAQNPENGNVSTGGTVTEGLTTYSYDANSNLASKTDSRGITINYSPTSSPIDKLNRVTQKTYSDGEPAITYTYDSTTVTNGVGRQTGMTDATGSTVWNYDEVGNVTNELRTTNGIAKTIKTSYDLLSKPYQITYPSLAILQYTENGAGEVTTATDITNNINYAQNLVYAPTGALTGGVYGYVGSGGFAGITLANSYNSRLQPSTLSATTASATIMWLGYNFGLGVNDNGNVYGITNNKNTARSQGFTYDGVNRVLTAQSGTWGTAFTYDAWANLYQTTGVSGSGLTNTMPVPADQAANPLNQLSSTLGNDAYTWGYLTTSGSMAYSFNAEGQIAAAGGTSYSYDGAGARVSKSTGTMYWGGVAESNLSGTLTSEYVFVEGKRVARRDVTANLVYYYVSDHLNSSNVVVNAANGSIENESDFYPFGGESQITNNLTNQRYKFTGKERDAESGLDYFGARYYANTVGRWMSADWAKKPEAVPYSSLYDPQSLNLYAYVRNSPITQADTDGHDEDSPAPGGDAYNSLAGQAEWANLTGGNASEAMASFAAGQGTTVDAMLAQKHPAPTPVSAEQIAAPPATSGTLTISTNTATGSNSYSLLGNHAWLTFTTDDGVVYTYGTYGNEHGAQGVQGVNENSELSYPSTASRTAHIDAEAAGRLSFYINDMIKQGSSAWSDSFPCSGFASVGWNLTTRENLDPTKGGMLNSPENLENSINTANGGH